MVIIFTKFHENRTKIGDFLLMANFWACLFFLLRLKKCSNGEISLDFEIKICSPCKNFSYRKDQRATSSLISQPRQGVNNNFQMKTSNGQKYSNLTCVWTVFSWSILEWTPYLPATWAVVKKSQFVNEQFCQLKFAPYWVDYGGCQLSRLLKIRYNKCFRYIHCKSFGCKAYRL